MVRVKLVGHYVKEFSSSSWLFIAHVLRASHEIELVEDNPDLIFVTDVFTYRQYLEKYKGCRILVPQTMSKKSYRT